MKTKIFENAENFDDWYISYGITHGIGYKWEIKLNINIDIFIIHDHFLNAFQGKAETGLQNGLIDNDFVKRTNAFGVGYIVKFTNKFGVNDEYIFGGNQVRFRESECIVSISNSINFYSDYPKDKESGKILNFSSFAKDNRESFNSSLSKFKSLLSGEIVRYEPQIGIYSKEMEKLQKEVNDRKAEEIDANGFKALSDRKEVYLLQEAQKEKKPFWKIF